MPAVNAADVRRAGTVGRKILLQAEEVTDAIVGEAGFVIRFAEAREIVFNENRDAAFVGDRERAGFGTIRSEMKRQVEDRVFGE